MSRPRALVALSMALAVLIASVAVAKEKKKPKQPAPVAAKRVVPGAAEAAIEAALGEQTELQLASDSPLADAIEILKGRHHIEIQLDTKALGDAGVAVDTPVAGNVNVKDVSLRSALNLILRPLNLTWTIENEVLLITTPEEAESHLITKVYDVADLVVCRDKDDELWDDYGTLIEDIISCIRPTTWDAVGGPGSVNCGTLGTAKVLIISQTYGIHRDIAQLLSDIREVAKKNPSEEPPRRDKPPATPQEKKSSHYAKPAQTKSIGAKGMF
jgi:hypothetical protein